MADWPGNGASRDRRTSDSHLTYRGPVPISSTTRPVPPDRDLLPGSARDPVILRNQATSKSENAGALGEHLHYDHIRPWSLNGADTVNNIQLLCGPCNRTKAARFENN